MKYYVLVYFLCFSVLISAQSRYDVSSSEDFNAAQDLAIAGDTIIWEPGTYVDTRMEINKDGIIVTAEPYGTALFTGVSRAIINADDVTFSGFQYIGGFIANLNVLTVFGSNVLITELNIQNYTSHKYLLMDEICRNNTISYCNFENRLNLADQNILSVLVDDEPGYHKIQYCSFKNFSGIGQDQGVEPIRIGVSSQGELDSRTLVEYCYFTQCNGDGEIISHKSRQNVYRYNTFENNPVAQLVLRHGDEGIIYGNFFLNNLGGIRIREGSDHFIYNNYFEGIDKNAIWLMNDPADPLANIHIYHNTIVNSEKVRLGGDGNNPPSNVTIANNVFAYPSGELFDADTGTEIWINNFSFGNLGIDVPATGLTDIIPQFIENSDGFFQPGSTSPVIASASDGYPAVPLYPGMDYDNEIWLDLMKESRPITVSDRAVGASEFSATANVQPHATEMNTGPSYLFENLVDYVTANASQLYIGKDGDNRSVMISSNIDWTVTTNMDWITADISSGTGDSQVNINIEANPESVNRSATLTITGGNQTVSIIVYQDAGDIVSVLENYEAKVVLFPNPTTGSIHLTNIPSGIYRSLIEVSDIDGKHVFSKEYLLNDNDLEIALDKLKPGAYLLNIEFINTAEAVQSTLSRNFYKN